MNNLSVKQKIDDCIAEIRKIEAIINVFGQNHEIVPFLTHYMVIKCCGTIESSFKAIISDYHSSTPIQARNYIEQTFTNSSLNPSKDNICKTLKKFDDNWNDDFKQRLSAEPNCNQLDASLRSLNNARNSFAHGGHPNASYINIKNYFLDSVRFIEILDDIIK